MRTNFPTVAERLLAAAAFVIAVFAWATFAVAAGGVTSGNGSDSGDAGASPHNSQTKGEDLTTCPEGQVWDVQAKKCQTKQSGALPDEALAEYAYALAKAERYQEAIETLDQLQNPNTPRALNYRGYTPRKMGRTEEGIGYYLQSVALDPRYAQVREYLGEAYLVEGKIDLAREQLDRIGKICGPIVCEEYQDLAEAIRRAEGS